MAFAAGSGWELWPQSVQKTRPEPQMKPADPWDWEVVERFCGFSFVISLKNNLAWT